MLVMKTHLKL